MRKMIYLALSVILTALNLNAQSSGIGVGLSWDGLNGKYWMNETTALAAQLTSNSIAIDYLLHQLEMLKITDGPTPVYYGGGAILGNHEEWDFEALEYETKLDVRLRGVVGMSYYLSSYPVDIFLEDTPAYYLLGGKGLDLVNLVFGIRYFF